MATEQLILLWFCLGKNRRRYELLLVATTVNNPRWRKKPFGQNLNRPKSSRPTTKRPGPSCQSIRLKRGGEQFTLSLLIFFPAFCRLCPACHSRPVGLNGGGSLPYVGAARRRSSLLSVNKIGLLATKVSFGRREQRFL